MRQIDVHFTGGNTAQKTFPVSYAIENREEHYIEILRCTVDLPQTQLPAWLGHGRFDLVTHVRDGMRLVDYNASAHNWPPTHEAESFRYKVYAEIVLHEIHRKKNSLAAC